MRFTLCVAISFLVIFGFDFVWHGNLLSDLYHQTAHLWRTQEEMMNLMPLATTFQLLMAFGLTFIFSLNFEDKGITEGLRFGLYIGIFIGILQAGIYPYMPIPTSLALMWFLGSFLETVLVGLVLGSLFKK